MKKITLTTAILLSVRIESIAQPVSDHLDQHTFQAVINPEKMMSQTLHPYHSNASALIFNDAHLAAAIHRSTPNSTITEKIHSQNHKKMKNAAILHKANEFVKQGNYESFLAYCTADTKWVFVGERILEGKDQVREYMKVFYVEPPVFNVAKTIEDGNYVTVMGEITLKAANGTYNHYDYCDVWRFEDGKIAELKAFVIEKKS